MTKHTNLISFAAGAAVCAMLGLGLGFTQPDKSKDKSKAPEHKQPEKADSPPDADPMMAEMMEKGTPGEQHKMLARTTGHWSVKAEFTMPGDEPMVGTGTMDTKMALGGRFAVGEFKLPDFMGAPFEGMSIMGYDKYTGEYSGIWIDTMTTHVTVTHGDVNEDGVLVMHGKSMMPSGENPMKVESTITENTLTDRFFDQMPDGTWYNSGTITYTRSGKGG